MVERLSTQSEAIASLVKFSKSVAGGMVLINGFWFLWSELE